ncbi:YqaA family protein [Nitrospina gracilis]|uniref:YqaA family protein n=1 Tax=Nitrospina gracilis TaxID=35801 RepID=UPI001F3ED42B|nr:YqaA family protein [Nitrospina gracilis]MCF8719880.1 membrane protein YqaA with SNARE-associated domain [Nitrospina gracilis Nb-211]
MESLIEFGYFGLFAAAFLAATILPFSSEVVLGALLINGMDPTALVAVATFGNVVGSVVNYGLGYGGMEVYQRKLSSTSKQDIDAALARYEKYGTASLLFAWVPVIGDPLTVAAGVLRVNLVTFLLLVTAGKLGRYVVITQMILHT